MKKLISYAVTMFFAMLAVSIASPDKDALITKEKTIWQAFKDKKVDDFKKLVSPSVMAVYVDGIYDLQKELDAMGKTDMKSFALRDFNVAMPDADTATITYKADVEGTADGKDNSGNYNCGSVWKKQNGEWKAVFHADMKETRQIR